MTLPLHGSPSRPAGPQHEPVSVIVYPDGSWRFDRAAYNLTEAGQMLGGVTRQHVAAMIRTGELRAVRLGRRVVVPATELQRVLAAPNEPDR